MCRNILAGSLRLVNSKLEYRNLETNSNHQNSNDQNSFEHLREPLIIINLSLPRRRESSDVKSFWIPAFAGMTFLEVALRF